MRIPNSIAAAALAILPLACSLGAQAQAWPAKPVRIVVPYPAGGGADVTARQVGAHLAEQLGQQFVIENRPGAGGSIGMEIVARSPADGYTLMVVPQNLVINPALFGKTPYDPIRDFAPIAALVDAPVMIGVHSAVPVSTMQELLAHLKANPDKLNYTTCGNGSPQHLAGELMKSVTGIRMQHIPYTGCAPAVADTAAGRVEILFGTIAHVMPHHKGGRMKALATTGATRPALAADFPTAMEAGVPDFDFVVWFGMLAPAKTPDDIVARANAAVNKALADPALRAQFEKQLYVPRGGSPEVFAKMIQADLTRFTKLVRDVGIKPELAGK